MISINNISVKGGVLNLVLFISLVVALFLSSMILLQYYHKQYEADARIALTLERNIQSSLAWLASENGHAVVDQDNVLIDLFGEQEDSVIISSYPWGFYQFINIKAVRGRSKREVKAIFGARSNEIHSNALVIDDSRAVLKLIGDTRIVGNVKVPSGEVLTGSLRGESFLNQVLVSGSIGESPTVLPKIDQLRVERFLARVSNIPPRYESGENEFTWTTPGVIVSEGAIALSHSYIGPVIIDSHSKIIVSRDCKLSSAILIAPEIIIEDSVVGDFQAFAKRSITIGDGVRLQYPSFVSVISDDDCTLRVGASVIEGGVVLHSDNKKSSAVILAEHSIVRGEVFVNATLEPYGTIGGTVVCSKLRFSRGG